MDGPQTLKPILRCARAGSNQKAAIITLVVTALSGLALLYVNMTTPGGASVDEIILLGTVIVILTALVPLYLAKVSWSWAAGMVSFLGLYLGARALEALSPEATQLYRFTFGVLGMLKMSWSFLVIAIHVCEMMSTPYALEDRKIILWIKHSLRKEVKNA